jgi:lichenan operon transcriptional antiterminator
MDRTKEIQLISYLLEQGTWVTTPELSSHLNLSSRSIHNYVSGINCKYGKIISSSNKGYLIRQEKKKEAIAKLPINHIPGNYEERKNFILEKILLSQQFLSIDSLSDELCISPTTLQNEISKLRNELSEFQLHLRIKNNRLSIIGLDRNKRRLILELINEELENSSFSLEKIQEFFDNVDLKAVKKIVQDALRNHRYFLDDYSLLNYILHIAVFLEFNNGKKKVSKSNSTLTVDIKKVATPHIYQAIEETFTNLKHLYDGNYCIEDFFNVSLSMMTSAISNQVNTLRIDQLDELVGPEIKDLLFLIIRSVQTTYSIDLKEDRFMIRFAFHLKNVIGRVENDIKIRNNQFQKIKDGFPFIYVVAVYISDIINKKTQHILSEDEIAYIALHIGVLMEEKKAYTDKLKCVILAPGYFEMGKALFKSLRSIFASSIIIANFVTSFDDLEGVGDYDLLFSTIEINPGINIPYIVIDPFLSDTSINNIFQKVEMIKQLKIKQRMIEHFKYFFREDLFFYDYPFSTHIDAIETMCDDMVSKNYVDSNYKKEIYEHEDVAPSSYGNIAIPHPLSNQAISSVIAISINPTPIRWGNNNVNIVFMLSLREDNRDQFKDIFGFISQLISNKESYSRILNAKTFDDFIDVLVSFAE